MVRRLMPILLVALSPWTGDATPGEIQRNQAKKEMESLKNITQANVEVNGNRSFEFIGHRGGSVDEYPKNILTRYPRDKYKNIKDLIELSFKEIGLTGVELDVQLIKSRSHPAEVFIIHDPVDGNEVSAEGWDYLKDNSFIGTIDYFFKQNYHHQGKKIFIELKMTNKSYDKHPILCEKDKNLIRTTFERFAQKVLEGQNIEEQRKRIESIHFVSFNFYALELMNDLSVQKFHQDLSTQLILIATTNKTIFRVLAKLIKLPFFNPYLTQKVIDSEWLDGIWFDPKWMARIGPTFNEINLRRRNPLFFQISTYGLRKNRFMKLLRPRKGEDKLINVSGLIFEFTK